MDSTQFIDLVGDVMRESGIVIDIKQIASNPIIEAQQAGVDLEHFAFRMTGANGVAVTGRVSQEVGMEIDWNSAFLMGLLVEDVYFARQYESFDDFVAAESLVVDLAERMRPAFDEIGRIERDLSAVIGIDSVDRLVDAVRQLAEPEAEPAPSPMSM